MPSLKIMKGDAPRSVCSSEDAAELLQVKSEAAELMSKLNVSIEDGREPYFTALSAHFKEEDQLIEVT